MKLSEAVKLLAEGGIEDARREARELFMAFGGYSAVSLLGADPDCLDEKLIEAVYERRDRRPLQYIIGKVGFYREEYRVNENCLIPRADTEVLVDYAVRNIPPCERFLDLCTGSGCVGISTLANTDRTSAVLVDLSVGALKLARENAEANGVFSRAEFLNADVLSGAVEGEYFALLSNPPYVRDDVYERLEKEIYHEPKMAFVGGLDGADFYRTLVPMYKEMIKDGGFMAFEIGFDQAQILRDIAKENNMSAEILKDTSGVDRVAVLRKG